MGYSIIVLSGVCDVESENHFRVYDVRGLRVFDPRFSWVLESAVTCSVLSTYSNDLC